VIELIQYLINALIGGVAYILMWKCFDKGEMIRHIGLALAAGYAYYHAVQSYHFPDSFMAIVVGYFADDFFEGLSAYVGKIARKIREAKREGGDA